MLRFSSARLWRLALGGTLVAGGCLHTPTPAPVSPPAGRAERIGKPQTADVQIAIARALEERGDTEQAVRAYAHAVELDPTRGDACARLAVLHDKQGKFDESARWYERALKLRPNDQDIYADRGYSRYLQGQWDAAERDLREALRLKPDHLRAHNNLGLVLARAGRDDAALASFRRAGCGEAEARSNLAYAMTLSRRWDEAAEQYRLALAQDASCAAAQKGLRHLERLAENLRARPAGDIVPVSASEPAP